MEDSARRDKYDRKDPMETGGTTYQTEMEKESLQLLDVTEQTAKEMEIYYNYLLVEATEHDGKDEVQEKINSFWRATGNIWKAHQQSYDISDELSARWKDLQKSQKRHLIPVAPANTVIDIAESKSDNFARGLNIYKLLLICFIGSFAGVVIEILWCLITRGYLESRSGLVYGPLNLLYGAGAVALTVVLYKYRNRGSWISFLCGMVVGSILEYVCSWGQELILGSRSWDYSGVPFNLNGRICLMYSIFWGTLGVIWIKSVYPRLAKWILKVPNSIGKVATWMITAFFIFNVIVTCVSIARWTQRMDGLEVTNSFWEFIDEHFPDERMESVFANMEFTD